MTAHPLPPIALAHDAAREAACRAVRAAPGGWVVRISPPKRSLDQNAIFHAICDDIAKAMPSWAGRPTSAADWKALLVDGHAIATGAEGVRVVPAIEGSGFVQLRESTAEMSRERASSLIEYAKAWAVQRGVRLRDRREDER